MVFRGTTTTQWLPAIETMADVNHSLVNLLGHALDVCHNLVQCRHKFPHSSDAALKFKVCGVGRVVWTVADADSHTIASFLENNVTLSMYHVNDSKGQSVAPVLLRMFTTT